MKPIDYRGLYQQQQQLAVGANRVDGLGADLRAAATAFDGMLSELRRRDDYIDHLEARLGAFRAESPDVVEVDAHDEDGGYAYRLIVHHTDGTTSEHTVYAINAPCDDDEWLRGFLIHLQAYVWGPERQ